MTMTTRGRGYFSILPDRPMLPHLYMFRPRIYKSCNPDPWRVEIISGDGYVYTKDCQTWESARLYVVAVTQSQFSAARHMGYAR